MSALERGRRPAVLLVDDIEANLVALEAQLVSLDCDIVRADSGNEALRQLLHREFAVILLDVQMPDMDGYEVARLVRDSPRSRDVPIVFVTAMHETEENVLQGYGSGAIDYLFKPVSANVLRSKVRVFLDLELSRRRLLDEIDAHKRTLADLEAFNYSISHDLRAPLRPLEGFAKAILEDWGPRLDDQARAYLARIAAAAARMGELIEDLLALSRVSRTPIRRVSVDFSGVAAAVVAELRANDPARQVEVVVEPGLRVAADAGLLRIILENLLRNAWKFTRDSPGARIEVGARQGDGAVFFVKDNGVGFDPAFADRLFQPFQRLHNASDFEGTGIGLAIVKRIVDGHRGRAWAESAPGRGATVFFSM